MTMDLFVIEKEQRFSVKQIQKFAYFYYPSWFPHLDSYSGFSK